MFRNKRWALVLTTLLLVFAFLAACQAEPSIVEVTRVITETVEVEGEVVEVTRVITETEEVVVTVEVPVEEEEVEPEPEVVDRTGAWVDTVIVVEEPSSDAGVTRLQAGDIDVYAYAVSSPETAASIRSASGIVHAPSYGSYNELSFNPAACEDENRLNPFNDKQIREAMNWAVDRDFIVQEIMGGLGTPRYVAVNAASADAARLAAEIRQIELQYAYDLDRARDVISERMEELGATLEGGVWTFAGAPVELSILTRTEDERLQIGDYVANQLEDLGFTVIRDYKTSAEASPIWYSGAQTTCEYHVYTGGWVTTVIDRDAGGNFEFFYTPVGQASPMWQLYEPSDEFVELATRLGNNDFTSLEERTELFAQILPLSMEESYRVWLLDRTGIAPYREEIAVSSDLSGSVYGSWFWPYTLRRGNEVGGSVTIAMPSILTEPWNPVAGSNWIYDQMLIRSTDQLAALSDPSTGLYHPVRLASGTVTVQEGLPVAASMDWVTVETAPEIVVPDEAWASWDAESQTFITAGDFYTETETAAVKIRAEYDADLFEATRYHDGSPISVADFVMRLIIRFDRANEASAIFDQADVASFNSFASAFKGYHIVSEDPLVIEYYTDAWQLDAENHFQMTALWPYYPQGPGAWHNVGLGIRAEEAGLAAWSQAKATELEVERLNYISGPVLEILAEELTAAVEENYIPYEATLGQFVSAEEAAERYSNLEEWYRRRGHFWIGTGPMFLQRAFPVEGNVILTRNPDFPDQSGRWDALAGAPLPQVDVEGPTRVTIGDEAVFEVFVDDPTGEPYAAADIGSAQYLLFDAEGNLVATGEAENVGEGLYEVVLSSDVTGDLVAGSNRLELVVVSNLVALPSGAGVEFVTAP